MKAWAARQRYLIDYAFAALWRHRAKTIGLWLVYLLVVFVVASVILFGAAVRREALATLEGSPDVVAQFMRMGRHDLAKASDLDKLKRLRGADQIEGRLWGYLYDTSTAATYALQVPSKASHGFTLQPGEAMVGEGVARLRRLGNKRFLFLVSPSSRFLKLNVKEIFTSTSALFTSDLVLLSEADFRSFFEVPDGHFTDLVMRVKNPKEIGKVTEKAAVALAGYRFITKGATLRTYENLLSWREGLLLALLGGALLAFGILAFDKASGLSAEEKREIGILKAIGWDTSAIIRMKIWEAGLISGTAYTLGVVLAYGHVFWLSAPLLEPVLKGWAVLYPRFTLTPTIDGLQLATLGFFTILPYMAAILVPIWRIASADPDEVMR